MGGDKIVGLCVWSTYVVWRWKGVWSDEGQTSSLAKVWACT